MLNGKNRGVQNSRKLLEDIPNKVRDVLGIIVDVNLLTGDWTIDDLMGKHRSRPYNPLIANTFFRTGFIEAWGRGIEKIKNSCKEAGNPIKHGGIMVMFKSLVSMTDQNTNQGTDHANQADVIGEKYSTVKYYMESMKKSGILKEKVPAKKENGLSYKYGIVLEVWGKT